VKCAFAQVGHWVSAFPLMQEEWTACMNPGKQNIGVFFLASRSILLLLQHYMLLYPEDVDITSNLISLAEVEYYQIKKTIPLCYEFSAQIESTFLCFATASPELLEFKFFVSFIIIFMFTHHRLPSLFCPLVTFSSPISHTSSYTPPPSY
jgi:hypothetical protein